MNLDFSELSIGSLFRTLTVNDLEGGCVWRKTAPDAAVATTPPHAGIVNTFEPDQPVCISLAWDAYKTSAPAGTKHWKNWPATASFGEG